MEQVTQRNAATAQESAAATEGLNTQSAAVKDIAGRLAAMVGSVQATCAKGGGGALQAPPHRWSEPGPASRMTGPPPAQPMSNRAQREDFPLGEFKDS